MQSYTLEEAQAILKEPTFEMLLCKEFKGYFGKNSQGITDVTADGVPKSKLKGVFAHLGDYPLELERAISIRPQGKGLLVALGFKNLPVAIDFPVEVPFTLLEDLEFSESDLPQLRYDYTWKTLFRKVVATLAQQLDSIEKAKEPALQNNLKQPETEVPVIAPKADVKEVPKKENEIKVYFTTATTAVRMGILALEKMNKEHPDKWDAVKIKFPLIVFREGHTEVQRIELTLAQFAIILQDKTAFEAFIHNIKEAPGEKVLVKWTFDLFLHGAQSIFKFYKKAKVKPTATDMAKEAVVKLQEKVKIWVK